MRQIRYDHSVVERGDRKAMRNKKTMSQAFQAFHGARCELVATVGEGMRRDWRIARNGARVIVGFALAVVGGFLFAGGVVFIGIGGLFVLAYHRINEMED